MPNKTIYVSDDDLRLFERAQELSGDNLSAAVVRALRRYIDIEEARKGGLDEITIIVGTSGAHRHKRFVGVRLARWLQKTADGKSTEVLNVYHTAGKRFALHTRIVPDWPLEGGDPEYNGDPKNWGLGNGILRRIASIGFDYETFKTAGDYSLEVFESLDELKAHVSSELFKMVRQAMDYSDVEDLDI